jgi:hypothetical protein
MWQFLIQFVLFSFVQTPTLQNADLPDDIAVCEAIVLQYLQRSPVKDPSITYYFDARPQDGYVAFPDAFFEKYKDHTPPFKKAAEFKGRERRADRTTEWSWSFKTPQRIDNDTYAVSGGYYCGGLCALHCEYRVVRTNGKWEVQRPRTCAAS